MLMAKFKPLFSAWTQLTWFQSALRINNLLCAVFNSFNNSIPIDSIRSISILTQFNVVRQSQRATRSKKKWNGFRDILPFSFFSALYHLIYVQHLKHESYDCTKFSIDCAISGRHWKYENYAQWYSIERRSNDFGFTAHVANQLAEGPISRYGLQSEYHVNGSRFSGTTG